MASTDYDLHNWYFAGSVVSATFSSFVIFSFSFFKVLRKHPSSIVVCSCICDAIFALQFFLLYAVPDSKDDCGILGIIFHFGVFSSLMWFFTMSRLLWVALHNPFQNLSAQMCRAHIYNWGLSLMTSVILAACKQTAYRKAFQVCWIKLTENQKHVNLFNWFFFFIPIFFVWTISIAVLVVAVVKLKKGLPGSFHIRRRVVRDTAVHVVVFSIYWAIAGSLYIQTYLIEMAEMGSDLSNKHIRVYEVFALVLGLRGLSDAIVWTITQGALPVYWQYLFGSSLPQHIPAAGQDLNLVLRKEVLAYTTAGIRKAVEQATLHPENAEVQKLTVESPESPGLVVDFWDHEPQTFLHLRRSVFGIDDISFIDSLCGNSVDNLIEKYTEGRSSSWFYFSLDNQYIVKTIPTAEKDFLVNFLPRYCEYMDQNRHSLIVKICGLFSIQMYNCTVHFFVMRSVFLVDPCEVHVKYDLKGSWVDRNAKQKDKKGVLKDCDLHRKLLLTTDTRECVFKQIRTDAEFLCSCNIMDYSLLIGMQNRVIDMVDIDGIHSVEMGLPAKAVEGPVRYFMGIIDILQPYDTKKQAERCFKTVFLRKSGKGISACPPRPYCSRFIQKIDDILSAVPSHTQDSKKDDSKANGLNST